jgi:hypothetical protein
MSFISPSFSLLLRNTEDSFLSTLVSYRVKKGQMLAVLDPEPYQLEVDAINAELIKAKNNVIKLDII